MLKKSENELVFLIELLKIFLALTSNFHALFVG
jgi:hypothetical protein